MKHLRNSIYYASPEHAFKTEKYKTRIQVIFIRFKKHFSFITFQILIFLLFPINFE